MSFIFDPSLITVNISSFPIIVCVGVGVFFFSFSRVCERHLLRVVLDYAWGEMDYPLSSTIFDDGKKIIQCI